MARGADLFEDLVRDFCTERFGGLTFFSTLADLPGLRETSFVGRELSFFWTAALPFSSEFGSEVFRVRLADLAGWLRLVLRTDLLFSSFVGGLPRSKSLFLPRDRVLRTARFFSTGCVLVVTAARLDFGVLRATEVAELLGVAPELPRVCDSTLVFEPDDLRGVLTAPNRVEPPSLAIWEPPEDDEV